MPRPGVPDLYRTRARAEGYVARAVYKLIEIDAKYRLFKAGQRVLDLGCSPGSWMQYVASRVGPEGLVAGVDRTPPVIDVTPPLYFILGELGSLDLEEITALSADFDVVLSDLAPSTTGVRDVDQQRSLELALTAWEWAQKLLRPGGHFLVKIFEGPGVGFLAGLLKKAFSLCRRVKPAGSRPASPELYLLGLNFKARPAKGQRRGKPAPQPV